MRASALRATLALVALSIGSGGALGAQIPEAAVPEPLRPWVPWVLEGHPELACPMVAGNRMCAWPGRLELDLDEQGGSFRLAVTADRNLDLPLPGDAAHWPRQITLDGRPALLRRAGEVPTVALPPGRHRLAGRFRWSRLPESLPVPPEIGLVSLRVGGRAVSLPRREEGGLLWLAGRRAEIEEERVAMEVSRRIDDGVPVRLTVRLALRVSGRAREVDLGDPLPAGFAATSVSSSLPVRLADGGSGGHRLRAQLRPGEWQITLEARSLGPVDEIGLADRPDPWPSEEFWAFQADLAVRSVKLEGVPGVDPQRTPLPTEWRTLPAFRVVPGQTLVMTELRRGQPPPLPDSIEVSREWWLAEDGERITSRDRLLGSLNAGGRIEVLEPAELGRVVAGDAGERVITLGARSERAGVEVRNGELELRAELAYPRGGALPAVGWDRDAPALSIRLNLPPGWLLLAAPGADRAAGALAEAWNLLDLFFLLLITLATWKLASRRWSAGAFVILGLAWHEPHAGFLIFWWAALLALLALLRVLPEGRPGRLVSGLRWLVSFAFALQLVLFCTVQWRSGIFPQLEHPSVAWQGSPKAAPTFTVFDYLTGRADVLAEAGLSSPRPPIEFQHSSAPKVSMVRPPGLADGEAEAEPQALGYLDSGEVEQKPARYLKRARQVDAAAVVQTGPGVPRWSWRVYSLSWSGAVSSEQRLRLLLISPGVERLLSLLRIVGVLLLASWLVDPRRHPRPDAGSGEPVAAAIAATLALLFLAGSAAAREPETPSGDLLAELERRLTAPPSCDPDCVETAVLALSAGRRGLSIEAEVHADARSAWALPGPAAAWTPERVLLDGQATAALRRDADGFLLLRLEPGTHRVVLSGPARDSLTLQMPLPPRTMEWRGDGWSIGGFRPDAPPPASVRLDRLLPTSVEAGAADGAGTVELLPWLELTRELDLGLPWLVHNKLERLGPSGSSVAVAVALLPGESVTTAGVRVEDGEAAIVLERGETARHWESTLDETDVLTLTAPADRPWLERWVLACSPIWSCSAEGLAPSRHMQDAAWLPEWRPWPGESVSLRLVRPAAAPGVTTTLDAVRLALTPGKRLLTAELGLELRTSRGGEELLTLPEEAELRYFRVDEQPQPFQLEEGRLMFTVEPGSHQVEVGWRQPHDLGLVERAPAVALGSPAANVMIELQVPTNRWLLWAAGPSWGSVVTLWLYLPLLAVAAWALGRWRPAPLTGFDWLLLGLGLTQVPLALAAVVVLWLIVFGLRDRLRAAEEGRWLERIGLGALWLAALGVLYLVIHTGLLGRPEMQIVGFAGVGRSLGWYSDMTAGPLARPWVVWLPLWCFRVAMLLWALWLSARLVRWLPWAWRRFVATH